MKISGLILLLLALNTACVTVSASQAIRTQNDSFSAVGVEKAVLETGAGSLAINGRSGLEAIEVSAEFKCGSDFASNSQRILDSLRLSMEVRGNTFHLKSEHLKTWNFGESGWIDITINMPSGIELEVDDGSGSINYFEIAGQVSVPEE